MKAISSKNNWKVDLPQEARIKLTILKVLIETFRYVQLHYLC